MKNNRLYRIEDLKQMKRLHEQEEKMGELSTLPNIGPAVEAQLNQVGIYTAEELREAGAKQAWLKIQQIDESACIHRLLALEGAIQGVKKTTLSEEKKQELKEFYKWHKK